MRYHKRIGGHVGEVTERIPEILDNPYIEAARTYYDPNRQLTQQQLGTFLVEHYDLSEEDPSSPLLAGTIAGDMYAAGAYDAIALRMRARHETERFWVEHGIAASTTQADQQAREVVRHIPRDLPRFRRAMAAADLIAWSVHGNTYRKSGKNAYEHPLETAAIALAGLESLEDDGHILDRDIKEQAVVASLLHDTFEDSRRQPNSTMTSQPKGISPLLVRRTLQLTGTDYAAQAANTLRHITRAEGGLPPKAQSWGRSYKDYVLQGRQDIGFCLAKPADVIHNSKHDPKPTPTPEAHARWQRKLDDYAWSLETIREQAIVQTQAKVPGWPEYLPSYIDAVAATTPADMPHYLKRLASFMGQPLLLQETDQRARIAA